MKSATRPESAAPTKKLSRVERKRRDARARIVSATETLMQARPLDELTIAEITDAADVGHGSFYLHFGSKHEVIVPIIHQRAEKWDLAIQEALQDFEDPAEVVAFSARQIARIIAADPLCRWFLQHSGVPADDMREALGRFVARDIQHGISSGRFKVPELDVAMSYLFGGIVNAMMMAFDAEHPERVIDHIAEMLLRGLGLSVAEAHDIAHRPLKQLGDTG